MIKEKVVEEKKGKEQYKKRNPLTNILLVLMQKTINKY